MNILKYLKIFLIIIGVTMSLCFIVNGAIAFQDKLKGKMVFSSEDGLYVINLDEKKTWREPDPIDLPQISDRINIIHEIDWSPNENEILIMCGWTDQPAIFNIIKRELCWFDDLKRYNKLSSPRYSPDGRYLALLRQGSHPNIYYNRENRPSFISVLTLYDTKNNEIIELTDRYAGLSTPSWSKESNIIVFETSYREIAIWDISKNESNILCKGDKPIFNRATGDIYYIGEEETLHSISLDGKKGYKLDNIGWTWPSPIDFSEDGEYLYYVGTSGFLTLEFDYISALHIESGKTKRISKRYGAIRGAALLD